MPRRKSAAVKTGTETKDNKFGATFAALREVLAAYSERLLVTVDKAGDYQVCSRTMKDRIGRPLFMAGVQVKKNYVSFHLLPIYMNPALQKKVSPALKKRMQGKACFNFAEIAPEQVREIAEITREGVEMFKNVKLPWEKKRPG